MKSALSRRRRRPEPSPKNTKVQSLEKDYVIRIKIPIDDKEILEDVVQGTVEVKKTEIDDYVLVRRDGTPTYMLSVVVDDHDLGVM